MGSRRGRRHPATGVAPSKGGCDRPPVQTGRGVRRQLVGGSYRDRARGSTIRKALRSPHVGHCFVTIATSPSRSMSLRGSASNRSLSRKTRWLRHAGHGSRRSRLSTSLSLAPTNPRSAIGNRPPYWAQQLPRAPRLAGYLPTRPGAFDTRSRSTEHARPIRALAATGDRGYRRVFGPTFPVGFARDHDRRVSAHPALPEVEYSRTRTERVDQPIEHRRPLM